MTDNELVETFEDIILDAITSSQEWANEFSDEIENSWDPTKTQDNIINKILAKVFIYRIGV